jgi:hypothetical protein
LEQTEDAERDRREEMIETLTSICKKLGLTILVEAYCDALEKHPVPFVRNFDDFLLDFVQWKRLDGYQEAENQANEPLKIVAEDLQAEYEDNFIGEYGESAKVQIEFLRKFGNLVPSFVWVHVWTYDMIREADKTLIQPGQTTSMMLKLQDAVKQASNINAKSFQSGPGGSTVESRQPEMVATNMWRRLEAEDLNAKSSRIGPGGAYMRAQLEAEAVSIKSYKKGSCNVTEYNFRKSDPTRREAAEEKLFELQIVEGEKGFVTALCDALDAQPEPVLQNFEELLDPEHWDNLRVQEDELSEGEGETILNKTYQTTEDLNKIWTTKLAKLQSEFLREHGHRIQGHVLPLTLAYEAMKEEEYSEEYRQTTKVLEHMGIKY